MEETTQAQLEEKPKRRRWVEVNVVERKGESVLVQWAEAKGAPRRAYVPRAELDGERCPEDVLEAGIPYGAPWEELAEPIRVSAEDIARSLRRHGIWTAGDVERDPRTAARAINALTGTSVAALRRAARKHEREQQEE